ncbi:MAG: D-alanyl-D-alanine carboxypeptidase family protein, partial [Rhodospirillales bacterium]
MATRSEGPVRPKARRMVAALFAALALFAIGAASAEAKYAAIVIDAETGRVLHNVNADTRNYPASLAKMMTLYLFFEAIEDGRLALDHHLNVSSLSARQPASRLGLKKGQSITVERAILALVTKSANDVAAVVAEALAGSQRDFALKMTATARRLGMSRTTFRNPSGLPHRGQLSTARDMATLARSLIRDFPQYYHYFSARSFSYGGRDHLNHNKLLNTYDGADGIKTGYIRASGFNLVASARRGERRLIGVIFGGKSPGARNRLMAKLLDKGFNILNGTAPARKKAVRRTAKKIPRTRPSTARPSTTELWAIQV